jgi:hypothetical protein
MITNDHELRFMRERIDYFQQMLADIRQSTPPEEFDALSSGYRLEIERMHAEVMEYLLRPLATGRDTTEPVLSR